MTRKPAVMVKPAARYSPMPQQAVQLEPIDTGAFHGLVNDLEQPAALAPKKPQQTDIENYLAGLSEELEERMKQAAELVARRQAALDEAVKGLRTLQTIAAVQKGEAVDQIWANNRTMRTDNVIERAPRLTSDRSPRGSGAEIQKAILTVLNDAPDGISRKQIISRMQAGDDSKLQQKISNALMALKKVNAIIHNDDGTYSIL